MNIIDQIVANKRIEVSALPPIEKSSRRGPDFAASCRSIRPFVIAEVKPASPAGDFLFSEKDLQDLLQSYNRHAQAISVLCDRKFFNGGYDLLEKVASQTELPLLAKEFFISIPQIRLAAGSGAGAVLLIPGIIDEKLCLELLHEALSCNLDILIEFHSPSDLHLSLTDFIQKLDIDSRKKILLGVNNRDLKDLTLNLTTTVELMPQLRETFGPSHLYVTESGIKNPEDAQTLRPYADGFLIGTGLLQAGNRNDFFKRLHDEN